MALRAPGRTTNHYTKPWSRSPCRWFARCTAWWEVLGFSYATEWFLAWYSGEHAERSLTRYLFAGDYAPLYWTMLACNIAIPQLLWFRPVRRKVAAVFLVAILINIGMWLERVLIIWNTLSHGYLPSLWRLFHPTIWDWLLLAGSLGFFAFLYLIFCRLIPVISMHEVARLRHEQGSGP
jgi:Ni/Fe-hydrogenase subunit HybB-like protein